MDRAAIEWMLELLKAEEAYVENLLGVVENAESPAAIYKEGRRDTVQMLKNRLVRKLDEVRAVEDWKAFKEKQDER